MIRVLQHVAVSTLLLLCGGYSSSGIDCKMCVAPMDELGGAAVCQDSEGPGFL